MPEAKKQKKPTAEEVAAVERKLTELLEEVKDGEAVEQRIKELYNVRDRAQLAMFEIGDLINQNPPTKGRPVKGAPESAFSLQWWTERTGYSKRHIQQIKLAAKLCEFPDERIGRTVKEVIEEHQAEKREQRQPMPVSTPAYYDNDDEQEDEEPEPELTEEETKAIELVKEGKSYRQIAKALDVDESSVRRNPYVREAREAIDPEVHSKVNYESASCRTATAAERLRDIEGEIDVILGPMYTLNSKDKKKLKSILTKGLEALDNYGH